MTLADRTITALRDLHDELSAVVATLTDDQLAAPSGGAPGWSVAEVLSHLGSGSEIMLASLSAATGAGAAPGDGFNQGVWDRWNAKAPRSQAEDFVAHDATLVEVLEALTPEQRTELGISLGFGPGPMGVAEVAGLRLNEVALHGWDVRVGLDPGATIADETADILLTQFAGRIGFLLGYIGKADALQGIAVVNVGGYGLSVADTVTLSPAAEGETATFTGPKEAAVRLLGGRLTPSHTAAGIGVDGNVGLDDLRKVFPGF